MTLQEQLNEVLQKVLTEKTFSTDALVAIQNLEKEYLTTVTRLEEQKKISDSLREEKKKGEGENNILLAELSKYRNRESELVSREKVVVDIEHQKALLEKDITHNKERANEIKEVISLVFRNTVMRKSLNHYMPGHNGQAGAWISDRTNNISEEINEE